MLMEQLVLEQVFLGHNLRQKSHINNTTTKQNTPTQACNVLLSIIHRGIKLRDNILMVPERVLANTVHY